MTNPLVQENELVRVEQVPEQQTLILRRLPVRPPDTATLLATYQEALAGAADFRGWSLILDMRAAPGRNDPEFEGSVGAMRPQLDRVFRRVVMLVGTAAGALQVRRLAKEQGRDTLVTHEEEDALRLCREA